MNIDWKRVNEKLRCPICGAPARISAGTDGTEGEHTHRFTVSRAVAMQLSQPSTGEIIAQINDLEAKLAELKRQLR